MYGDFKYLKAQADRNEGRPTIPTTVGLELKTNVFIRINEENVKSLFPDIVDGVARLGAMRERKNNFK